MPDSVLAAEATFDAASLSPFELKDRLLSLARESARGRDGVLLDAGRGNPDWVEPAARAALHELGAFAASRREWPAGARDPERTDMPGRLAAWLSEARASPGVDLLRGGLAWLATRADLDSNDVVREWVDGVTGGQYPEPPAMLPAAEVICRAHLARVLGWPDALAPRMRLFATEGASAVIGYVFDALCANALLAPGDRVAVVTPIFSPYLELLRHPDRAFDVVPLAARESDGWQVPSSEIARLRDPSIRMLVVVNPGNPTATALSAETVAGVAEVVARERDDLLILSDDVYGPLVPGYASLSARLPRHTLAVYSFSKYFGATGCRLGMLALHEASVADGLVARLPAPRRDAVAARYRALTERPETLPFLERVVAESRRIAFHHTAGLSTPQQVQMSLFALADLLDGNAVWRARVVAMLRERRAALWHGLGLEAPHWPGMTHYYETLDLAALAARWQGSSGAAPGRPEVPTAEVLERLAREHAVVVLPGEGFGADPQCIRVSLANLDARLVARLGAALRQVVTGSGGAP